jgi:hypothetical protein
MPGVKVFFVSPGCRSAEITVGGNVMKNNAVTNFTRPLPSVLEKQQKGFGSKVRDRIREWLDEWLPVVLPPVIPVRYR